MLRCCLLTPPKHAVITPLRTMVSTLRVLMSRYQSSPSVKPFAALCRDMASCPGLTRGDKRSHPDAEWFDVTTDGERVIYHYRLLSQANREAYKTAMEKGRPNIIRDNCNDAAVRKPLDRGATYVYRLNDANGSLIMTFESSKADCKEKRI